MDDQMKLKKRNLEAEKRLKKVEQDYLHVNQKYTESRTQWETLCDERTRAVNRCYSAATFVEACNRMEENLQKALDKLPTPEPTEEAVDHSLQISMSNNSRSLAQDNMMIIQKKAQCQMLDREAKRDFRKMKHQSLQFSKVNSDKSSARENMTILQPKAQCQKLDAEAISALKNITLDYIQRKLPRIDSRKAINELLKEVKEKNKCRFKALFNCTMVCNPANHQGLRKSVELEIKVLKKLIRELKKDCEGKQHIKQYATNICKDYRQKTRHLVEKKEHLSGQWDEEKKRMQEMEKKRDEEKKRMQEMEKKRDEEKKRMQEMKKKWDEKKKRMQEKKKKRDRTGTYPEAEYTKIGTYPTPEFIKMVNDNLP